MRISKEYDERKNEILDTAERLFHTKGYEKTTINDILKEVNIAKGTFYYYFKSKEEVMDALIERVSLIAMEKVQKVAETEGMDPQEKMLHMFLAMRMEGPGEEQMLDDLHRPENALMHQKLLNYIVVNIAPLLAQVVKQGVDQGIWKCPYPLEYMKIFLAASTTLMDDGIFEQDEKSQMEILTALLSLLETMLKAPEGSILSVAAQYWG